MLHDPTIEKSPGAAAFTGDGRQRVVIEHVTPEIDGGRFPIKRVVGETVTVRADVFGDGHDELTAVLLYRKKSSEQWHVAPLHFLTNDRWEGSFRVEETGIYSYTVSGRIDHFATWKKDFAKKGAVGQDLAIDRLIGGRLVEAAAERAAGADREHLREHALRIRRALNDGEALAASQDQELGRLMRLYYDTRFATSYGKVLEAVVEPGEALCGAWYELFPRSSCTEGGAHGTFADCIRLLPRIAAMGFDIVYFPPIHPIGVTNRKGKNNATKAEKGDPGSPWAVGAAEGGHKAVHPDLGTLDDFRIFVEEAKRLGLRVALDIAFQCSPDHPHVREHPGWFRWRPDGSVQFAENPPKKYEDIIPFDFECEEWESLWEELKSVFLYWVEQGVTIFRVDNPHTKPFHFWEWVIAEVRKSRPEAIFLSEAFTRPKVMYRLAKLGFSQSYTYFSWRNTKPELEQYIRELSGPELREYFRPNFWPNTPDILPEFLQFGGKPAFFIRFVLAATLSSSYGVYGPPYDLFINEAIPGKEEYLDSEKYEVRCWDWDDPRNMRDLIARVNAIRRHNAALQTTWNTRFCETDNDNIICYLKSTADRTNMLLIAVSLDPFGSQSGRFRIPLERVRIVPGQPYLVHDLLNGAMNLWHGEWNQVELSAQEVPAKIWRIYPRLRRENDFDYFM